MSKKKDTYFVGVIHPAALLKASELKPEAFTDYIKIREKVGEICERTYPEGFLAPYRKIQDTEADRPGVVQQSLSACRAECV